MGRKPIETPTGYQIQLEYERDWGVLFGGRGRVSAVFLRPRQKVARVGQNAK